MHFLQFLTSWTSSFTSLDFCLVKWRKKLKANRINHTTSKNAKLKAKQQVKWRKKCDAYLLWR
jgi:hypothetical protein